MLGLNKFQKIKIIHNMCMDQSGIYKKSIIKSPNMWILNNILLYNLQIKEETIKEVSSYFKWKDNENIAYETL